MSILEADKRMLEALGIPIPDRLINAPDAPTPADIPAPAVIEGAHAIEAAFPPETLRAQESLENRRRAREADRNVEAAAAASGLAAASAREMARNVAAAVAASAAAAANPLTITPVPDGPRVGESVSMGGGVVGVVVTVLGPDLAHVRLNATGVLVTANIARGPSGLHIGNARPATEADMPRWRHAVDPTPRHARTPTPDEILQRSLSQIRRRLARGEITPAQSTALMRTAQTEYRRSEERRGTERAAEPAETLSAFIDRGLNRAPTDERAAMEAPLPRAPIVGDSVSLGDDRRALIARFDGDAWRLDHSVPRDAYGRFERMSDGSRSPVPPRAWDADGIPVSPPSVRENRRAPQRREPRLSDASIMPSLLPTPTPRQFQRHQTRVAGSRRWVTLMFQDGLRADVPVDEDGILMWRAAGDATVVGIELRGTRHSMGPISMLDGRILHLRIPATALG